jgi:hypothetical protein
LINEYLDGEIGLADKAQLEQIMADNPRVRDEYERLRKMGSMLGLMPEVRVHPYKFRAKLNDAMSTERRGYFTPQRAFSAAMLVVLVVFVVTFGLFAYQQQIISGSSFITGPTQQNQPVAASYAGSQFVVDTGVSAEQFFSRLALEHQVGLLDSQLFTSVVHQTSVYEGARCADGEPLAPLRFARSLPRSYSLTLTPGQLSDLAGVAEELSGYPARVVLPGGEAPLSGGQLTQHIAGLQTLTIQLQFK